MNDYPERPVFTEKEDDAGRKYLTGYTNELTNCCVSWNGKNIVFKGQPKLNVRTGASAFGDELVIEFLIDDVYQEYDSRTNHESVEIYFPKDKGVAFLKRFIAFLEGGGA